MVEESMGGYVKSHAVDTSSHRDAAVVSMANSACEHD